MHRRRGRNPTSACPKCQSQPQTPPYPEFLIIDKAFQTLDWPLQEADDDRSRGRSNWVEWKGSFCGDVAYAGHASAYSGFESGTYLQMISLESFGHRQAEGLEPTFRIGFLPHQTGGNGSTWEDGKSYVQADQTESYATAATRESYSQVENQRHYLR